MGFTIQTGRWVAPDGVGLHYTWTVPTAAPADRPPLVFCNGVGLDSTLWQHMLEEFQPRNPTLTWDYRGHGRSEKPLHFESMKLEDHRQDLESLLQFLKIERGIFIGHSMGAQVIFEHFSKKPDQVAALVSVCGTFENPFERLFHTNVFRSVFPMVFTPLSQNARRLTPVWRFLSRLTWAKEIALFLGTNRSMVQEEDCLPYLRNLSSIDLEFFLYALRASAEHSAREILPKIQVPTLVIAGEWDHFTPLSESVTMAEVIPGAELMVVPQGSHCALLDQPELINLRIEEFLKVAQPSPGTSLGFSEKSFDTVG